MGWGDMNSRQIGSVVTVVALIASSCAQMLNDGCSIIYDGTSSTIIYDGTFNSFSSMGTPTLLPSSLMQSPGGISTTNPAQIPFASTSSSTLSSTPPVATTTTTTASTTPSPTPFYIEVSDATSKARRAFRYLGFEPSEGGISILTDKIHAALFILTADGYLMSGGEFGGTADGNTGVLHKSPTRPSEPFPWTFNGTSISFGDSKFCYFDNTSFVVYDGEQPDGCNPAVVAIEVAPRATTSTSTTSSTEVETFTTTTITSLPTTTTTTTTTTQVPHSTAPFLPPSSLTVSSSQGTSSHVVPQPGTSSTMTGQAPTSHTDSPSSVLASLAGPQQSSPGFPSSPTSSLSSTVKTTSSLASSLNPTPPTSSLGVSLTSSSRSSSISSIASSPSSATASSSGTRSSSTVITTGTATPSSSASYTSSSSTSSATPSTIPLRGKRGLAYTNVNTTVYYPPPTQVSWSYNYYSLPNRSTNNVGPYPYTSQYPLKFYPLLFNDNSALTSVWFANVNYSIANYGTDAIFSFNEPDACFGGLSSCMTVAQALAAYKTWIQPFAGKVLLGAPAVTNAGSGSTWLSQFLGNATQMGLTVDFINIHWYASPYNMQYFMDYMAQAQTTAAAAGYPNRPVWITEYGMDNANYAEAAVLQFLKNTTYWVDIQPNSFIAKTCWFGNFANNLLNANATGRSVRGEIWNNPSTGYVYGFSKREASADVEGGMDVLERRQMEGVGYYEYERREADGGQLDGWEVVQDEEPEEVNDDERGKWNWKDVGTGMDEAWLKIVRGEE